MDDRELPEWVLQKVIDDPKHGSISKHEIEGKTYWYFDNAKNCCDRTSDVYDEKGIYICSPKGGITGKGSGDCPPALREHF